MRFLRRANHRPAGHASTSRDRRALEQIKWERWHLHSSGYNLRYALCKYSIPLQPNVTCEGKAVKYHKELYVVQVLASANAAQLHLQTPASIT